LELINEKLISKSLMIVVVSTLAQKVKTSVKKKDVNPEWNEELTLSVSDSTLPLKLVG
jgi:Ca2+-dependent lipid-binding protein